MAKVNKPKPESVKTSLKIRTDLWRGAKTFAAARGTDLSGIVNEALEAFIPRSITVMVREEAVVPRKIAVVVRKG